MQPTEEQFKQFLESNNIIAIDTEFSIELNVLTRRLAYIQLYGFETQEALIFTYTNNFLHFPALFYEWLCASGKEQLLVGFYILGDLINIWRLLSFASVKTSVENTLDEMCLLGKVCDLYLMLKFMHNGYKTEALA